MSRKAASNYLLLLAVALVVAVAGCVGTGTTSTGGPGLAVEKFEPTLKDVQSNQDVMFVLQVRNQGDVDSQAVAELLDVDKSKWNLIGDTYKNLNTLLRKDPTSNTEGGLAEATWQARAPIYAQGQIITAKPRARVYYTYQTWATKNIWFVTPQEQETLAKTGGSLTTEPTVVTSGPLRVDITTGNFVPTPEWQNAYFQVQIDITNQGTGVVFGKNYPVAIRVEYPDNVIPVNGQCPMVTDFVSNPYPVLPPYGITPPNEWNYVYMWDTEQAQFTCNFQVVSPPVSREVKEFGVKVAYIYQIDAVTDITVRGTTMGNI